MLIMPGTTPPGRSPARYDGTITLSLSRRMFDVELGFLTSDIFPSRLTTMHLVLVGNDCPLDLLAAFIRLTQLLYGLICSICVLSRQRGA